MEDRRFLAMAIGVGAIGVIIGGYVMYDIIIGLLHP